MQILTLNAGSSSIKYKVFKLHSEGITENYGGLIEGIGENRAHTFQTHQEALEHLYDILKEMHFDAVAHRVVHGGENHYKPTVITPTVRDEIAKLGELAPIHNPINLQGIDFAVSHFNNAKQVAIFDTGFHHTLCAETKHYPISPKITQKYKIMRYGFHGINHEFVARQAADYLNLNFESSNFITLHLGNGASTCLIQSGKSIDTSMGMTPLAGLMMGTRSGDIDPAIPLFLCQKGFSAQEIDSILNKQSGLLGIGGDNDMRHLDARAKTGCLNAQFAIDMYVYRIKNYIGAYLAHLSKLDGLIFTGGIGENAAFIRERILNNMTHLKFHIDGEKNQQKTSDLVHSISSEGIPILVIKGNEEYFMAQLTAELLLSQTPESA
jgi:acetate kinase